MYDREPRLPTQPPAACEGCRALGGDPDLTGADCDQCLLEQMKRGHQEAFETLHNRYHKPIIHFASQRIGDPAEAQDIAQKVFVQVYRHVGRLRFTDRFSNWLYAIARNICRNEMRRRTREKLQSVVLFEGRSWPNSRVTSGHGADAVLLAETEAIVERTLSLLPERERMAIILLHQSDCSYEEIASNLGVSLSATKSLIHRGRCKLKKELQPYV